MRCTSFLQLKASHVDHKGRSLAGDWSASVTQVIPTVGFKFSGRSRLKMLTCRNSAILNLGEGVARFSCASLPGGSESADRLEMFSWLCFEIRRAGHWHQLAGTNANEMVHKPASAGSAQRHPHMDQAGVGSAPAAPPGLRRHHPPGQLAGAAVVLSVSRLH